MLLLIWFHILYSFFQRLTQQAKLCRYPWREMARERGCINSSSFLSCTGGRTEAHTPHTSLPFVGCHSQFPPSAPLCLLHKAQLLSAWQRFLAVSTVRLQYRFFSHPFCVRVRAHSWREWERLQRPKEPTMASLRLHLCLCVTVQYVCTEMCSSSTYTEILIKKHIAWV